MFYVPILHFTKETNEKRMVGEKFFCFFFLWCRGERFASFISVFICRFALRLHIAGAQHGKIYLFDYCPASWHVLLIDGFCFPAAAGLLVSLAQNSLKDSSADSPFTLLHFCFPPPPPHQWLQFITQYLNFSFPFISFFFRCCCSSDANAACDLPQIHPSMFVSTLHECPLQPCEDERPSCPLFRLCRLLLGDLAFNASDVAHPLQLGPAGPHSSGCLTTSPVVRNNYTFSKLFGE